jgi:putative transposase
MPRLARSVLERGYFHVLNRGNHRQDLFHRREDFAEFVGLMSQAQQEHPVKLWGYCLMSNHWHLVVEVDRMEDLSGWIHRICHGHVRLYNLRRKELGGGHLYQGRYKSFPIQDDVYLYQVLRYVEANPVRAGLVERAREWPWSSLSQAEIAKDLFPITRPPLEPWDRSQAWENDVDRPLSEVRQQILRQSIQRGTPLGESEWVEQTVKTLGMETTIRLPGRPSKNIANVADSHLF